MISDAELQTLLQRESKKDHRVLSVHLNVDQSRMDNRNRNFEVVLRNLLREIEQGLGGEQETARFRTEAERVSEFVSKYRPAGKSLVLFSDSADDYFWERSLRVPLDSVARWLPKPYVRPLIEARDEFERYAVVLTDREKARLFIVYLGEIEEEKDALATAEVRKFDASSKDQMWSQMKFQHKAEEHHRLHQKHVAEILDRLGAQHTFDRLLIAGPPEAASALKEQLSPAMEDRLVDSFSIRGVDAPEKEVLEKTMELVRNSERKEEEALVDRFVAQANGNHHIVAGLGPAVEALLQGRVDTLVYSNTRDFGSGAECADCGLLMTEMRGQCPHCRGELRPVEDLLGQLVESTARQGGHVEQLRDDPARRFQEKSQGIGALLRF